MYFSVHLSRYPKGLGHDKGGDDAAGAPHAAVERRVPVRAQPM